MQRSRLGAIARADLPRTARLRLLWIEIAADRLRRRGGTAGRDVRVPLGGGLEVWLRGPSLLVDYWTFCDIFVDHCFLLEEEGAVVVDAGAHCGYFGAYALARGAHAVYSLEPQRDNFTELERNVASFRGQGYRWDAERCAVGSLDGMADLHLSSESWSHSLYAPASGHAVGVERVRVRSLHGLLAELAAAHPNRALLVKLNIEGAAGRVILDTPVEHWTRVDHVLFDFEPGTAERLEDVLRHLAAAGHEVLWNNGRDYRLARLPD